MNPDRPYHPGSTRGRSPSFSIKTGGMYAGFVIPLPVPQDW